MPVRLGQAQHIARAQRAATVAAELSERESGAAAHVLRHIEAALHGQVAALPAPSMRAAASARCRPSRASACHAAPASPSSVGGHACAGQRDHRVGG